MCFEDAIAEIMELSKLEDNWNGDDACGIDEKTVDNALSLIKATEKYMDYYILAYPTCYGDICMEYKSGPQFCNMATHR